MPAETEATGIGVVLGERMRERRLELGKKLAQIAAEADVSVGYLSAIENGISIPSLPVLARISHALELSLSEMLRKSASPRLARGRMTHALGRKSLAASGSHMQIVRLASRPGHAGRAPVALDETDVFVFLHHGRLTVAVDGTSFELEEGDALHCDMPHEIEWRVPGPDRAVALWVGAAQERPRRLPAG